MKKNPKTDIKKIEGKEMKKNKNNNIFNLKLRENVVNKKLSKKRVAIAAFILVILLAILVFILIYAENENFRIQVDEKLLFKKVEENSLPYISIENMGTANVFAWEDTIAILQGNKLTRYDAIGKDISQMTIDVTDPVIKTENEYAVIAEKNGNKVYCLKKKSILWEKELQGQISRICVNKNGYVGLVITGTTYKSVIQLYNESGEELFKTYLSNTVAVNIDISDDNKYVALAEVNLSGTILQTNVKVLSIEKAKDKNATTEAIVYTYHAEANQVMVNMKYDSKNRLICQYDDSIHIIQHNEDNQILSLEDYQKQNSYIDINLNNYIVTTSEENKDLFTNTTEIKLIHIENQKNNQYHIEGTVKALMGAQDKVGISTGKEVYFVGNNGWLIKKYTASGEIKNLIMNHSIAGIMYKNKIELIDL